MRECKPPLVGMCWVRRLNARAECMAGAASSDDDVPKKKKESQGPRRRFHRTKAARDLAQQRAAVERPRSSSLRVVTGGRLIDYVGGLGPDLGTSPVAGPDLGTPPVAGLGLEHALIQHRRMSSDLYSSSESNFSCTSSEELEPFLMPAGAGAHMPGSHPNAAMFGSDAWTGGQQNSEGAWLGGGVGQYATQPTRPLLHQDQHQPLSATGSFKSDVGVNLGMLALDGSGYMPAQDKAMNWHVEMNALGAQLSIEERVQAWRASLQRQQQQQNGFASSDSSTSGGWGSSAEHFFGASSEHLMSLAALHASQDGHAGMGRDTARRGLSRERKRDPQNDGTSEFTGSGALCSD